MEQAKRRPIGVGRVGRHLCAVSALALAGCTLFPEKPRPLDLSVLGTTGAVDATPEAATAGGGQHASTVVTASPQTSTDATPQALATTPSADRLIFKETAKGTASNQQPKDDPLKDKPNVALSFVNAPATDVARALVSDILGRPLAIAATTQAKITLAAPSPVPAGEAMALLEAALAEAGLALQRAETGYVLTTLADAGRAPQDAGSAGRGYGVTIEPVKHALASELLTLIQPFVSSRLAVTADDTRSVLLFRGPQTDVATAREAMALFDAPRLADRTYGMFRIENADPASLTSELVAVLEANASGKAKSAELIPLPRLNLLFVSARSQQAFDTVADWIEKLDTPAGGDEPRLHYYIAQNTSAATLAEQVGSAFGASFGSVSGSVSDVQSANPAGSGSAIDAGFRTSAARGLRSAGGEGVMITTDAINNALIIRTTDRKYREIAGLIKKMDVLAPQVLIEATIAEVTLTDSLAFGIRWSYANAESRAVLSDNAAGTIGAVFPGFNYSYIEGNVRATLDALASQTEVTILSTPSIMVLNNQTANLQVGDQVPIITQQASSVVGGDAPIVSTVQLRDTGVILEVKPRINASDVVVLEISQEVSDVAATTTSGIDSPTIQQRKFSSTVAVKNNGTVALGGLIRETHTDTSGGVPLLKDVPLLGYAFKSRDVTKRRTELIVFLTPRIVRGDEDAQAAILELRREMVRLGVAGAP